MLIYINAPELDGQETRLSADVAAAATTSTVENNKSFATNDLVVFGALGEELTEIVTLTSTSGTTTLGHTVGPVFAHSARTSVSQIRYNQAKVYSCATETGSYSLLDTVNLTLDQDTTIYNDTAGTATTWYKIKYYNSVTAVLSSFSVAVQGTGYTDDSLKSMADEVLEDFGDPEGEDLSREQVYNYLRGGVRKITTEIIKTIPDYRKNYSILTLSSGVVALPSNFLGFIRIDAGSSTTDSERCEYVDEGSLYPDRTYSDLEPKAFIRGSNLYIYPNDIAYAYVWYWDYPTPMTEENDEHGLPYGGRDVLVNYALYKAYLSKDIEKAASYKSEFKDSLEKYIEFVSQARQQMTKGRINIVFGADMYED